MGLPAMWVMMAVTVGGSTTGVVGMLVSVPWHRCFIPCCGRRSIGICASVGFPLEVEAPGAIIGTGF